MHTSDHLRAVPPIRSGEADHAGSAGVLFPQVDGRRSTTITGRAILADAAAAVDPDLERQIRSCAGWRSGYMELVREITVASAAGQEASLAIARAGLESMRSQLVVERGDQVAPLDHALGALEPSQELGSGHVQGTAQPVTCLLYTSPSPRD